jgi:hypothetical protein
MMKLAHANMQKMMLSVKHIELDFRATRWGALYRRKGRPDAGRLLATWVDREDAVGDEVSGDSGGRVLVGSERFAKGPHYVRTVR